MQSKANKWPPFGSGGWILIPKWNTTRCSSEMKHVFHLRSNISYCRNRWKHSACSLVLSSVSRCLEPVMKHSPSFLTYYSQTQENWWKPEAISPRAFIVFECLGTPASCYMYGLAEGEFSCLDRRKVCKKKIICLYSPSLKVHDTKPVRR